MGRLRRFGKMPLPKFGGSAILCLMTDKTPHMESLRGQILIATPAMTDPRFTRSVILMCNHDSEGAMGLVLNRPKMGVTVDYVLEQTDIEERKTRREDPVLTGGPVSPERGFVLHSSDFQSLDDGIIVTDELTVSATRDALYALVSDTPPRRSLFSLGYAGWSAGQLEDEILRNAWLTATPHEELIFDGQHKTKWTRALDILGVKPEQLSMLAGHA